MVNSNQLALKALNLVIIVCRSMAYKCVPQQELAEALDVAEYLVLLIASADDKTSQFVENLQHLTNRWPEFNLALELFSPGRM